MNVKPFMDTFQKLSIINTQTRTEYMNTEMLQTG
jgi:hypothetical protein